MVRTILAVLITISLTLAPGVCAVAAVHENAAPTMMSASADTNMAMSDMDMSDCMKAMGPVPADATISQILWPRVSPPLWVISQETHDFVPAKYLLETHKLLQTLKEYGLETNGYQDHASWDKHTCVATERHGHESRRCSILFHFEVPGG